MPTIKSQLKQLYLNAWDGFSLAMKNDPEFSRRSHPHLISMTDSFEKEWSGADLRIMLVGISTNGWGQKDYDVYSGPAESAIDGLMEEYEKFYFDGGNWHYAQVFWNYVYSLQELLKYRLGQKVSLIWSNVHKTDPGKWSAEQDHFNVLEGEVAILQPDMIILFGLDTRHTFHRRLSRSEINWDDHEAWSDQYPDKPFLFYNIPGENYRHASERLKHVVVTYHPNARGDAGIKMKLLVDEIVAMLNKDTA